MRVRPLRLAAALAVAVAAVLGPVLWAVAQPAPSARADEGAITFRHLTVEQGLPSDVVLSLTQDALGFVWVGTDEGLARYDGVDIVEYTRGRDSTGLPGNLIQALAPAPEGDLWVGTEAGLARYDAATDRFHRLPGLPADDVLAVAAAADGGAWVGTPAGAAYVDGDGRAETVAGLPDPFVKAVHTAGGGDVWIGTGDGLALRPAGGGALRVFRPDSLDALGAFDVSALAPTADGQLLVGTFGDGLHRFDPASGAFERLPLGDDLNASNVSDVLEDPAGTIWAGTLEGGLRRLAPDGTVRVYEAVAEDLGSLVSDEVSALHLDRQGVLWVGTYGGLDRFDRARGTTVRLRRTDDPASLASNDVRAVLAASDGTLYVGTDRTLDVSTDGRTFRHVTIPSPDGRPTHAVRALYEDESGTVWVGTEGTGPRRIGPDGEVQHVPFPGEHGDVITAFLELDDGRFWMGTASRGLALYDRQSEETRFLDETDGLASDQVRALAEDADGRVWVGTDAGVCRLGPTSDDVSCLRSQSDDPAALASDYIYALHARRDGTLWLGTKGGLRRLDTRDLGAGFTTYTADETDLPDDDVRSIVEDDDGYLWLSTGNGLVRFEPFAGVFSQRLGDQGADRTLTSAASRAPDGRLYFGSTRGLLAVSPQTISARNANPPEVAITDVEVNGVDVEPGGDVLDVAAPLAEEIELGHDDAYLAIRYAGLHFSDPARNTYRYRMLGLFDEWNEVGSDREATFTALPPGDYVFEVQAANADGVGFEVGAGAQLAVVVHPPWWRTWWALLGFAALAVFALARADRWQRARLLRQERERAERREAELRAETAEAEQRKATAEAAALKAENDRKAAELERTREVEAANAKLAAANDQLEASLRDLQATQAQLVQSEKLASLGQLTAGIAHEIKNPLNFVNNFADLSVDLAKELREEMEEAPDKPAGVILEEVGDLLDDLQENCRRIHEHGQRADRIVRSMLLHSRGGSSERGAVGLNRFVDEYANLAFHGARANDSDFQVEIVRDFDEAAGEVEVVPQEFGRVLINLLTNAFHAVNERARAERDGYAPTVTVRTRRTGQQAVVEVEDNGTGIPAKVKERIFEPFFTTKKTGEGTGLGLSLAHDIVTGVHGGTMTVESEEGEGTTFRIELPTGAKPG